MKNSSEIELERLRGRLCQCASEESVSLSAPQLLSLSRILDAFILDIQKKMTNKDI